MKTRVRMQGNGVWLLVDSKENVYEVREKRRRWQWSQETSVKLIGEARPHFCYKEVQDRGVSATCRRCRVEREGITHKPVPSCARPVSTGMGVWRETPMVAKGREGVRERRLRNHPLDCPVCDQGGECDLQEQTRGYGTDRSRRFEGGRKRAVEDKEIGGQVKMVMTRCIHCTRCVRYSQGQRGIRGRGTHAEIGRYTSWNRRDNPRVGGRVDRCPVGARTQETEKFADRSWERETVESVNRRDGRAQPVSLTYRGGKRIEVKPKRGIYEIVSDKARYGRDGREYRRRETTWRVNENGMEGGDILLYNGMLLSGDLRIRKKIERVNLFSVYSKERINQRSIQNISAMGGEELCNRGDENIGSIRRGSGVDRERVKVRKGRTRQNNRPGSRTYLGACERNGLRRHRGEFRVSVSGRTEQRYVGVDRGEVRPTRCYGRMGRDSLVGVGQGVTTQRSLNVRNQIRNGVLKSEWPKGRVRGSSRWQRGDGQVWVVKGLGGEVKIQRRVHQPNGVGLLIR